MEKNSKIDIKKYFNRFDLKLIPSIVRCSCCNKKYICIDHDEANESELTLYSKEHGLCYECAYWLMLIEQRPDGLQITNGICYILLPYIKEPSFTMILGGKGAKRYFVTKDMKAITSNDVWRVGTIPERFRHELKDTGWFCDSSVYKKLSKFNKKCNEAGCLDRYKCFRFKTEIEIENGPFNTLPKKWVDGGEHCRYFINTDLIKNYVSPLKCKQ